MCPVANDLKRLRNEAGKTQQQLADEAGLLRPTIARIEDGRNEPSAESMFRIARALGVGVADIFHLVEEQPTTIIQKAAKVATKIARGGATVFVIAALWTMGFVLVTEVQSASAFYAGNYIQAMALADEVSPLVHPLRDRWWNEAVLSAESSNVGISRGYMSPVPSVSVSRKWLNKYDGLVDRAPIDDMTGWLLHDERADFLDRVGASQAAYVERENLIRHPVLPEARSAVMDFGDYVQQAFKAEIMRDPADARQLLAVARSAHPALFARVFARRARDMYEMAALRPLVGTLGSREQ